MIVDNVPEKYRHPPQKLPAFKRSPKDADSIVKRVQEIIENRKAFLDKLAKDVKVEEANFENMILPMIRNSDETDVEENIIHFYKRMSPVKELREASREASKLLNKAFRTEYWRQDIACRINAAMKEVETLSVDDLESLDQENLRLLKYMDGKYYNEELMFRNNKDKERYHELRDKLADLKTDFDKEYAHSGGMWLDEEELHGLPQQVKNQLTKGDGENTGKLWIEFKIADRRKILEYVENPEVRKRIYEISENRNTENANRYQDAMLFREEIAHLRKCEHFAQLANKDSVLGSWHAAEDFLADLRNRLRRGGQRELKSLLERKKEHVEGRAEKSSYGFIDNINKIYLWDYYFYERKLLATFNVDPVEVSEYFELDTMRDRMLDMYEKQFGLIFVRLTAADRLALSPTGNGDDVLWLPESEMQLYSVWNDALEDHSNYGDEADKFLGYLYLDLIAKDGKTEQGATFEIKPGCGNTEDGREYPVVAIHAGLSHANEGPKLLQHREVRNLFHELGHAVHTLVSKSKYSKLHGLSIDHDFLEVPSQMLEFWFWDDSVLKSIGRHYETGLPMPDKMIEGLIKSKNATICQTMLYQLLYGLFDIAMYTRKTHDEDTAQTLSELFNRLRFDFLGRPGPEDLNGGDWTWGNGQVYHQQSISATAGTYYRYQYALICAYDMFHTMFKKDLSSREMGMKFRHSVLKPGGNKPGIRLLEDFLGRLPNEEAYAQELGIDSKSVWRKMFEKFISQLHDLSG